jgi:phosphotransferase system  glucose/maltose/N-acetylglucosamine-specific IIC component
MMMSVLKGSGIVGSIAVILALVIYLLKTLITFIAFLTGAIKIIIILAFVALIVGVGLMVFKGFMSRRPPRD